jgi:hypothetical protein
VMNRRNRPTNRWGCKPTEDVCVEHDEPLLCRHGCAESKGHECKERNDTYRNESKG